MYESTNSYTKYAVSGFWGELQGTLSDLFEDAPF